MLEVRKMKLEEKLAILAAVWMAVGRNGSKEVPMSQLEDSSWAEPDIEEFHVGWE